MAVATACGGSDDPRSGSKDVRRLVAYVCAAGETDGLCVVDEDGRNRRELASSDVEIDSLAWSSDGETIAYRCIRRICVVDVDGGDPREIPYSPESDENMSDRSPAWSPRRRELAFARNDGVSGIFVAGDDGEPRMVIGNGAPGSPTWSSDGERIAFGGVSRGKTELFVVNRDGSAVRILTRMRAEVVTPSWSPNGDWIAFQMIRGRSVELWVVDPEGGRGRRLARSPRGRLDYFTLAAPRWSPDSAEIAYPASRDPERVELRVVQVASRDVRTLTRFDFSLRAGIGLAPDWSPGGELVFPRTHGRYDLDLFAAAAGSERQLTDGPTIDYWPLWQPG